MIIKRFAIPENKNKIFLNGTTILGTKAPPLQGEGLG